MISLCKLLFSKNTAPDSEYDEIEYELETFPGESFSRQLVGNKRERRDIDTIVYHRYKTLDQDGGNRYIKSLNNNPVRIVSWHYSVGKSGKIMSHQDLERTCWHCRYPSGTNARSVGIEIYGPFGSDITDEAHKSIISLSSQIIEKCPINTLATHEYMDSLGPRKNRRDPGPEFDFDRVAKALGFQIEVPGALARNEPVSLSW